MSNQCTQSRKEQIAILCRSKKEATRNLGWRWPPEEAPPSVSAASIHRALKSSQDPAPWRLALN